MLGTFAGQLQIRLVSPGGNILQNCYNVTTRTLASLQCSGEWGRGVIGPGEGPPCLPQLFPSLAQFTPVTASGGGGPWGVSPGPHPGVRDGGSEPRGKEELLALHLGPEWGTAGIASGEEEAVFR